MPYIDRFSEFCNHDDGAAQAHFAALVAANGGLSRSFRQKFPRGTFRRKAKTNPTPVRFYSRDDGAAWAHFAAIAAANGGYLQISSVNSRQGLSTGK